MSTPESDSVIETFRDEVVEFLQGKSSVFSGVPILARRVGEPNTTITEAFNSAAIFGEVSIFQATVMVTSTTKDILIDRCDFYVDFYENVPLNQGEGGTRKGAWMLAQKALQFLLNERMPCTPHIISVHPNTVTLEDVTKDRECGDLTVRLRLTTKLELLAIDP